MKPYKNLDYAINRLNGCIVRTNEGVPILVRGMGEKRNHLLCVNILSGSTLEVDNNNIDMTPVPLGFVNERNSASYIVRTPMREDWRQGLRSNNCRSLLGNRFDGLSMSMIGRTICNKFPKLSTCVNSVLRDRTHSRRAFNRHWAVEDGGVLLHRATPVGTFSPDLYPILNPKYSHLERKLQEAILENN